MRHILLLFCATVLCGCVDPVVPEYDFQTGFYLIEGRIADIPGYSEVRVTQSAIRFDNYTLVDVDGVRVFSVDESGDELEWVRTTEGSAFVPSDASFAATTGRAYQIRVVTPDGEVIESTLEQAPTKTEVSNLRTVFNQETYFSNGLDRFVPAFRVLVDVDDPAVESNYYQYELKTFVFQAYCAFCERSVYRDGECIPTQGSRFIPRYDYLCDAPCWSITRGEAFNIVSDEINPGGILTAVEAGVIDYNGIGGQLAEVTQFGISRRQFDYNQVIKDLTEGSGGLNAPIPAALYGNLSSLQDPSLNVLGYVGVNSVDTARIFIDRDEVDGDPLPFYNIFRLEPLNPSPPVAPCVESPIRTRIKPTGWPF